MLQFAVRLCHRLLARSLDDVMQDVQKLRTQLQDAMKEGLDHKAELESLQATLATASRALGPPAKSPQVKMEIVRSLVLLDTMFQAMQNVTGMSARHRYPCALLGELMYVGEKSDLSAKACTGVAVILHVGRGHGWCLRQEQDQEQEQTRSML